MCVGSNIVGKSVEFDWSWNLITIQNIIQHEHTDTVQLQYKTWYIQHTDTITIRNIKRQWNKITSGLRSLLVLGGVHARPLGMWRCPVMPRRQVPEVDRQTDRQTASSGGPWTGHSDVPEKNNMSEITAKNWWVCGKSTVSHSFLLLLECLCNVVCELTAIVQFW